MYNFVFLFIKISALYLSNTVLEFNYFGWDIFLALSVSLKSLMGIVVLGITPSTPLSYGGENCNDNFV